jgi:hypothetical protein
VVCTYSGSAAPNGVVSAFTYCLNGGTLTISGADSNGGNDYANKKKYIPLCGLKILPNINNYRHKCVINPVYLSIMNYLNTISSEINALPLNKLEELHLFIRSLQATMTHTAHTQAHSKKILAFAGIFNDMNTEDYRNLSDELKKTRQNLFNRSIAL